MKTNKQAQLDINKKAQSYFEKQKQTRKKVIINALTLFLLIPAIALPFSMNLFGAKQPIIDNSAEDSVISDKNNPSSSEKTESSDTSLTEGRKIIYADTLNQPDDEVAAGPGFVYIPNDYDKKLEDPENKDAHFFVQIRTGVLEKNLYEEIKNNVIIPGYKFSGSMRAKEISYYQQFVVYLDHFKGRSNPFGVLSSKIDGRYVYRSKVKINDDYQAVDFNEDGSVKYYGFAIKTYEELQKHFSKYTDEYIDECAEIYYELEKQVRNAQDEAFHNLHLKCFDSINLDVKFDDFNKHYSEKGMCENYFTYITLDEIKKLEELPFGMHLILLPKSVEEQIENGTFTGVDICMDE